MWTYPTYPPPIQSELFYTALEKCRAQSQKMLGAFKPPTPQAPVRCACVGCSDLCPAAFRHHERCVDEAFLFIQHTSIAKLVGDIRQHATQNFIAAPSLKAPMHRFVVRITLRQHMPLRACVEYPQHSFQHTAGRYRFASRTSISNVLLRKMMPDALPLLVRQSNHSAFITDRLQPTILR